MALLHSFVLKHVNVNVFKFLHGLLGTTQTQMRFYIEQAFCYRSILVSLDGKMAFSMTTAQTPFAEEDVESFSRGLLVD